MASVPSTGPVPQLSAPVAVRATSVAEERPDTPNPKAARLEETDARLSSDGQLQSALVALQDAVRTLRSPQTWQATRTRSSDPGAVTSTSDPGAPEAQYTVRVVQTAKEQVSSFSSLSTPVAIAMMHIESGQWDAARSTFTTNPNWPKASITFGPKDTSMEQVRDRINAAGVGVLATVLSDATGTRLILRATGTGVERGFRVSAESSSGVRITEQQPLDAAAVQALASGWGSIKQEQPAQDAIVEVDGVSRSSPDGVLFNARPGLHLRADKPTDGAIAITVEPDPDVPQRAVQQLAASFNALKEQVDRPSGTTSGDRTERAATLLNQVAAALAKPRASTSPADMGVALDEAGRIQIDDARLAHAVSRNPSTLQDALAFHGLKESGHPDPIEARPAEVAASTIAPSSTTATRMKLLAHYQADELASA